MRRRAPSRIGIALRLAAVFAIGAAIRDPRVAALDERMHGRIVKDRRPELDVAMPIITDLGSVYALGGAAGVLVVGGARKTAGRLLLAGGLAWIASQALKPLYRRERPYETGSAEKLVRTPAGSSYPSGHPAVAEAMRRVLEPEVAFPGRSLVASMPKLVAFSRIYNGVHHPSDTLGGLLLGRAAGDLVLRSAARR
jgi:undecaprenyl-diphosphatase